jgi:hypothetical protein
MEDIALNRAEINASAVAAMFRHDAHRPGTGDGALAGGAERVGVDVQVKAHDSLAVHKEVDAVEIASQLNHFPLCDAATPDGRFGLLNSSIKPPHILLNSSPTALKRCGTGVGCAHN